MAQARDLSSMHAPMFMMFGLRACFNFFGQGTVTGQRGMKRGAAEKMRGPAAPRLGLKKFARADHHDILEKRRLAA